MNKHTVIGIDLAKRSIQICAVNTRNNKVIKNKAVNSNKLRNYSVQIMLDRVFLKVFEFQLHTQVRFYSGHSR